MSAKRIRVREATPADVDAIAAINFSAFDDNVLNHLMYPGGPSESTRNKFAARVLQQITAKGSPTTAKAGEVLISVAEYLPEGVPSDGPGEVVAFARWLLHREPLTEEEWNVDDVKATTETWGEGVNVEVVNTFIGDINRKQRDHAKGEAALCKSRIPLLVFVSHAEPSFRSWAHRLQPDPPAFGRRQRLVGMGA